MRSSFKPQSRQGATLLEIIGCVLAVGVGVWLGARFLGINLETAAYTALAQTEMIDKIPEGFRPKPPEGMEPLSEEAQEAQLLSELNSIRREVAILSKAELDQSSQELTPVVGRKVHPEIAERRQHTLAFWSRLGGIRSEVDKLQLAADEALNQNNVYGVLEIRKRAYEYGSKAVKAAKHNQVDAQALQFADQLMAWYEHGAELYGEALNVWQSQHLSAEGLSSDQLLEQVQRQHDNEAMLLFQKSGRLCEVLVRRYQVAFPEIEEPATLTN